MIAPAAADKAEHMGNRGKLAEQSQERSNEYMFRFIRYRRQRE
jgi:hypothetical protein